jgi:hypothetical protein
VIHRADRTSRLGLVAAVGRSATINGSALFRLEGSRIAEAWLQHDELGVLLQLRHLHV